jgi:hypothetical protein
MTTLPALFSACKDCRNAPVYRTRQKAFAARPALAWHQCCEAHRPGVKVNAPLMGRFHETERL